ncbi:MAG: alpha/beta hydrolase [Ilumatobacteraceae bacterium]
MKISRRARIMRRSIASFALGAEASLEERREAMDRIDRMPRPRKVDYVDTTVGGVEAIVATPTRGEPERDILYLHGGGYIIGSPRSHIALAARLAKRSAARVTVIDYRLAPEHPYPAAIEDCLAAYRALVEHTDPALVTIAGDSAGGGATLATLVALRDAGDTLPACGYLLSPWTDLTASGESYRSKAIADPMIDGDMIEATAVQYAADTPLDDPGVSPLFADLHGLPPLLIQTGSEEVLLSDSTDLAERATATGVDVQLDVREGMWHVYQAFAGLMPEATEALIDAATFIRTHSPAQVPAATPA